MVTFWNLVDPVFKPTNRCDDMASMAKTGGREPDSQSIIRDDGSIYFVSDLKETTWQSVLQATRLASSVHLGWDYPTYWWKRGVEAVFDTTKEGCEPKGFTRQWFTNSLNKELAPRARTDFKQIADRVDALKGASHSRDNATSENKLNWEISKAIDAKLKNSALTAYELYLVQESKNQLKVDIAVFCRDGVLHLIELKKEKPDNSPLLAAIELICYACQICLCRVILEAAVEASKGWSNFHIKEIVLHAVAPNQWPGSWWKHGANAKEFEDGMKKLAHQMRDAFQPIFPVRKIDFVLQSKEELIESLAASS